MNRMTGIIVMIIGVLIFIVGAFLYNSSKNKNSQIAVDMELDKAIQMAIADGVLSNNERNIIKQIATEKGLDYKEVIKDVEKQLAESDMESETELIDFRKKQGDDFEKFIVQKFDKKYYKLKEWAGDKYINGVYAETTQQPDLKLELKADGELHPFSVECKWKQTSKASGVIFCSEDQFKRYKAFEKEKEIPVFIALGIGGKGTSPEQLHIVPLRFLDSNFIPQKTLKICEKEMNQNFYYNLENGYINSSSR